MDTMRYKNYNLFLEGLDCEKGMEYKVLLNSAEKVRSFVAATSSAKCDIDLIAGRSYLDAKSILGILSVNLKEPVRISINSDNGLEIASLYEMIKEFTV